MPISPRLRSRSNCLPFLCFSCCSFLLCLHFAAVSASPESGTSGASRNLWQEQSGSHEVHCSRERSRAASKIIDEYLRPFIEKEGYQLSTNCKLHHENSLYSDQEQHKIHSEVNEWKCGYCQKKFYEERYLDMHFDNRHFDMLNVSHGRCLADLCGALHCDAVTESTTQKTKCNPAAAARNRHLCESVADNCFPVNHSPSASRLHEFFLRQFCDAHSCNGNRKPFSRGRKKHTSVFYIIISILVLLLLPLFYLFIYMYQRGIKSGTQELKRISQATRKKKPF